MLVCRKLPWPWVQDTGKGWCHHCAQLGFKEGFLASQGVLAASQVFRRICGTWHSLTLMFICGFQTSCCPQNDAPNSSCRQMNRKAKTDLFPVIDFICVYISNKCIWNISSRLDPSALCVTLSLNSSTLLLLSSVLGVDLLLQWETRPWARQVQNKWTKVKSDGLLEL